MYAHTRRPYCTCTTCASAPHLQRLRPHALSTPTPRTTRSLPNRRAPRAPRGCQPSDTMINMTGMDKHDLLTAFDEEQKHDDGCRTVHLLTALLLALAGIVRVVAGRPAATIASRAPKSAPDRGKDTPARAGIVRRRKGPVRGLRRGHVRTHTLKLHARIERANRQRDALRPTSTRHALATREHATAVAGWRVSNRKRRSAEREVRRDEKRVKDSVAIWNKCVYRARVYSTRKAVGPCGLPLPAPYLLHVRGGDETSPARDYAARDDYEAAQRRAGEAREAAAGSRRRLEVGRQVEAADRERALRAVAELVWARREARTAAVAAPPPSAHPCAPEAMGNGREEAAASKAPRDAAAAATSRSAACRADAATPATETAAAVATIGATDRANLKVAANMVASSVRGLARRERRVATEAVDDGVAAIPARRLLPRG